MLLASRCSFSDDRLYAPQFTKQRHKHLSATLLPKLDFGYIVALHFEEFEIFVYKVLLLSFLALLPKFPCIHGENCDQRNSFHPHCDIFVSTKPTRVQTNHVASLNQDDETGVSCMCTPCT